MVKLSPTATLSRGGCAWFYLANRAVAATGGEPDTTVEALSFAVASVFTSLRRSTRAGFPQDDDQVTLKTLLVWSYTMLWRLLAFCCIPQLLSIG